MFYKHWKKVLLSLTAFFWASCDTSSSATEEDNNTPPIDNPDPRSSSSVEETQPSSSSEDPASSSATEGAVTSSESATQNSSSSAEEAGTSTSEVDPNVTSSSDIASSNDVAKSSSSMGAIIAPKYGVYLSSSSEIIAPKYGVPISSSSEIVAPKYGVMFTCERKGKKLACDDGVTCVEEETETVTSPQCSGDQVCAKYGVVYIKETTYKCDDGKVYNYAEFQSKYNILDGAVDLYGCPSDICGDPTAKETN